MHVTKWSPCPALLCLLIIGGCGKESHSLKPRLEAASRKNTPTMDKSEGPQATSIAVTGEKLTEDFKANKEEAEKKYQGKVLEVEAVVEGVYPHNGYVTFKAAPGMELQSTKFGSDFLKNHPEIAPGKTIKFHASVGIVTEKVVNLDDPKLITPNPPK